MGALPDLFDCLDDVALFVLCESPVTVGVVSSLIVLLGLLADLNCLSVEAMHVIEECDVVISVWMRLVNCNALFEVFKRLVVHLCLEIRQAKVVLELRIV